MYNTIQSFFKSNIKDTTAIEIAHKIKSQLQVDPGKIKSSTLYTIKYEIQNEGFKTFAENCIQNKISKDVLINSLYKDDTYKSIIAVAQLPGVTDDEGISAQMALNDFLNMDLNTNVQQIFTQKIYYFEYELETEVLQKIAYSFLGNPLINHFQFLNNNNFVPYVPKVEMQNIESVETINLNLSDDDLEKLSEEKVLALSLEELLAIRKHFENPETQIVRKQLGLSENPTDIELEIIAQTWSEHCKHKEFNAEIQFENKITGAHKIINSLFKTYIKGSTDVVQTALEKNNNHWLIKVFTDNAGLVKVNNEQLFAWKVETHNSPSALDPYGGAITGVLGCNRDIMGTGVGGAELLFNTNVLCFGPPNYNKPLLKGQLHPRRIMEGVIHGIEDGGNKSGVPTVNGSIVFDDRFAGKPLVFCGSGGLLPMYLDGKNAWEKPIDLNDRIIMAGGRVGKDGIHGATFSSIEINENSPISAVQIGSPIIQKKLADFMSVAAKKGLIKSSTDNGAGGLSSSIGELSEITNGALIDLEKIPLKYNGLKPWEIFVSESQERMTIVVEPNKLAAFMKLAQQYEIEATDIGYFTNSGYLNVRFNNKTIGYINLNFLHNGVPQKKMMAILEPSTLTEPENLNLQNYNQTLLALLSNINICSRENVIRKYDHEVKGRSIIKPLMGEKGIQPQDAAVMRLNHESFEGIAISNGIMPKFGDIDAYHMSCGAFDEAVRQIIAVGGSLPNTKANDGVFWTVNDNFCVPDSEYHPTKNPDGKQKLAKLIQMCEGLFDMATFFDIPMTSGKDSMKNDFKSDGVKISVPPTILYSMVAKIDDVRKTITSNFKTNGDLIYQIGETFNELGGSEFYKLQQNIGTTVPEVRKEAAKKLYLKMMSANALNLIQSAHDLSDGGLAITLCECLFGTNFGAAINLNTIENLSHNAILFSESHSRFVVSVTPQNQSKFEAIFENRAFYLGKVTKTEQLIVHANNHDILNLKLSEMENSWKNGLNFKFNS